MRWTPEDFAEAIGAFRREIAGMVRRFVLGATSVGSKWQMLGHVLFDPTKREAADVEVFSGVGVFARPPAGNGEAIVVEVGGANGAVAIATRDEATRALVDDIKSDETALHNSECRLYLKSDGSIEARTHSGVAVKIPRLADLANLIVILNGAGTGAATAIPAALALNYDHPTAPTSYIGTYAAESFGLQKLKGE